jgi:hypothetical protein
VILRATGVARSLMASTVLRRLERSRAMSLDQLLRAVIRHSDHPGARGDAQRLARMAPASELNGGNVIFRLDEVDTLPHSGELSSPRRMG